MNEKMPEGATQEKLVSQEGYTTAIVDKPSSPKIPQFIPKLLGKKVTIRPVSGGQPISGVLEGFNLYELKVSVGNKREIIVFKHSIHSIEVSL